MLNSVRAARPLTSPILDSAAVAEARSVVEEKFPKMLRYYLEDCAASIAAIAMGLEELKAEAIAAPAHTLKSASRYMGAMRLGDLAEQIEIAARQEIEGSGSLLPVPGLLKELRRVFEETGTAFRPYLEN